MRPKNAVLIHGAGGGAWEYDLWQSSWTAAGWNVVAKDLQPGTNGLAQTTLTDYVRQVRTLIETGRERIVDGPFVLVGASMGGIIALQVVQQTRPSAVVLVNSVAPRGVGLQRSQKPYPPVVKWANGPLADTRDSMPDSGEATIQKAWKRWRDESGMAMNALRAGVVVQKPRCPVLVVLGDKDTDVPHTTGLALAKWANADTLVYRGMSHVGPLLSTRAGEVARTVAAWCNARTGTGNTS